MLCEYKWILFKYQLHKKTLLIVMISLFALLSLTIKWTRINSSTAWQQGKKHWGSSTEASCRLSAAYCQRNKLTKSFRPFFILNLRLQRDHRCIKRNNTFSVLNTPQKTDSDTWGRVAEVFRKTTFAVQWPTYLEKYYPYCTAGGITRSLCGQISFGHARRCPDIHRGQTREFFKGVVSHPMLVQSTLS